MHENREISCTSWLKDQDRSAKAIDRTADVNVQEKSDCAVVPVNQSNKEERSSARSVHGFARLCWATTNTMLFQGTRRSCASFNVAFAGCREVSNLVSTGMFFDIAVRDVEMALAAFVLARITEVRRDALRSDVPREASARAPVAA